MQNLEVIISPQQLHYNSHNHALQILFKYKRILINTDYELQKYQAKSMLTLKNNILKDIPSQQDYRDIASIKFQMCKQMQIMNTKIQIIMIGCSRSEVNLLGICQIDLGVFSVQNPASIPKSSKLKLQLNKCDDPNAFLIVNVGFSAYKPPKVNKIIQQQGPITTSNGKQICSLETQGYKRQQFLLNRRNNKDVPTAYQISHRNYKRVQIIRDEYIQHSTSRSRNKNLAGSYKKRFQYHNNTTYYQDQGGSSKIQKRQEKREKKHEQPGYSYQRTDKNNRKSPVPRMKTPEPLTESPQYGKSQYSHKNIKKHRQQQPRRHNISYHESMRNRQFQHDNDQVSHSHIIQTNGRYQIQVPKDSFHGNQTGQGRYKQPQMSPSSEHINKFQMITEKLKQIQKKILDKKHESEGQDNSQSPGSIKNKVGEFVEDDLEEQGPRRLRLPIRQTTQNQTDKKLQDSQLKVKSFQAQSSIDSNDFQSFQQVKIKNKKIQQKKSSQKKSESKIQSAQNLTQSQVEHFSPTESPANSKIVEKQSTKFSEKKNIGSNKGVIYESENIIIPSLTTKNQNQEIEKNDKQENKQKQDKVVEKKNQKIENTEKSEIKEIKKDVIKHEKTINRQYQLQFKPQEPKQLTENLQNLKKGKEKSSESLSSNNKFYTAIKNPHPISNLLKSQQAETPINNKAKIEVELQHQQIQANFQRKIKQKEQQFQQFKQKMQKQLKKSEDRANNLQIYVDEQEQNHRKVLMEKDLEKKNAQKAKQQQIISYQKQIAKYRQQNIQQKQLIDKLNLLYDQSDSQNSESAQRHEQRCLQYEEKIQQLKTINNKLKQDSEAKNMIILKLEDKLNEKQEEQSKKERRVENSSNDKKVPEQMKSLHHEIKVMQERLKLAQQQQINLQTKVKIKDNEQRFFKIQIDNLKQQKKDLENQIDILVQNDRYQLGRKSSINRINLSSQSLMQGVKNQNKVLKGEIQSLRNQVSELNKLLETIISKDIDYSTKVKNLQKMQGSSLKNIKDDYQSLLSKYQILQNKIQSYEEETTMIQSKIADIVNIIWDHGDDKLMNEVNVYLEKNQA